MRAGDGSANLSDRPQPADGGTVLFQVCPTGQGPRLERCASRRTFAGHARNGGCESRQRCSILTGKIPVYMVGHEVFGILVDANRPGRYWRGGAARSRREGRAGFTSRAREPVYLT